MKTPDAPATPAAPAPLAPWLAQQARDLLQQQGHAWLLQGPSGLGQYTLALALASAWLCERPSAEGSACGVCTSCHGVAVRTHPDLCVLMPEAQMMALGWPVDERSQKELDEKKRKPSREIRIEAMREAVEFAQRTSSRARGKVVLVYPAERMNHITANALLKTLEEPAGDLRFVLASEAAHLLLPTIRSRCMAHTLRWPDEAAALHWLAAQGMQAPTAAVLLRAAGGRPDDALALAQQGVDAAQWQRLPRALIMGQQQVFAGFTPAQTIGLLQKICHDALAVKAHAAPRFFGAADLPRAAHLPDWAALAQWARALAQAVRSAEHPYNAALMQQDLLLQGARALRSNAHSGVR